MVEFTWHRRRRVREVTKRLPFSFQMFPKRIRYNESQLDVDGMEQEKTFIKWRKQDQKPRAHVS